MPKIDPAKRDPRKQFEARLRFKAEALRSAQSAAESQRLQVEREQEWAALEPSEQVVWLAGLASSSGLRKALAFADAVGADYRQLLTLGKPA